MWRRYLKRGADTITEWAFSRRRFKLLMRAAFEELPSRSRTIAASTSFFSSVVRPIVLRPPFGDSVLVVAPHQDDEVIGCGGVMALHRRSGSAVRAVVLQDGADEHVQVGLSRAQLVGMRNEESRAAARVIGATEPIFLNEPVLRMNAEEVAFGLRNIVESDRVEAIFVPFILDAHPDHRMSNVIVSKALSGYPKSLRVFQYEVWGSCIPNVVVVIDDVVDQKVEMLKCFRFANGAIDYAHATIGLNMFHSRLLPAGRARYVEAFFESPLEAYLEMVDAVTAAEHAE